MRYVFAILFGTIILFLFLTTIIQEIRSKFDHTGWKKGSIPDRHATIANISSEKVKYDKNDAKFKTTVLFSDGFYFITHRTNRENRPLSYTISIDTKLANEIVARAKAIHNYEINKIEKSIRNTDVGFEFLSMTQLIVERVNQLSASVDAMPAGAGCEAESHYYHDVVV